MNSIQSTEDLGRALRAARKQLGLTQPQLALAAGVGVRFIVDLEAGKTTLRLENVLRVIDALGGALHLTGLPSSAPEHPAKANPHGA
jgi:HTH-type transcriptional regulator / antitoxin HipB